MHNNKKLPGGCKKNIRMRRKSGEWEIHCCCPPVLTYCSLSGGAERRRRDGIVLSTKSLIVTAEEKALLGGGSDPERLCVACLSGENVLVCGRQFAGERVGEREATVELRVRGRVSRQLDWRVSPWLHFCACLVKHIKNTQIDVRHRLEIRRGAVPLLAEDDRAGALPLTLSAPRKLRGFVPFDHHQVDEP